MGFAFPNANTIIAGCCDSLYRTTNNGINWSDISTGVSLLCENISLVTNGSNVFLSSCGKIYLTTNGGTNWLLKNQGLESNNIISFHIAGSYIFAGTYLSSVWRRTYSETIKVKKISTEIPSRFILYQNYPNPFNSISKIKYQISKIQIKNQKVKLAVYNSLGQVVAILINREQEPGTYEVTFDGNNLASGIYFYQLRTGDPDKSGQVFVETKRFVLLK
jgi:hypothetical protein